MTPEAAAKKDTQKLQRAIVDGLEDVKAQDIQVFNTEHLSPLFERVIVASGTSNRQTKALAASVRDAVREAGFPKPRIEGEDNGEWIIVDCGAAVAHIMQPAIRQYYHLEEIWGDKPVRLKLGAPKPAHARRRQGRGQEGARQEPVAAPHQRGQDCSEARLPSRPRTASKAAGAKKARSARKTAAKTPANKAPGQEAAAGKPARKPAPPRRPPRKAPSRRHEAAGGRGRASGCPTGPRPPGTTTPSASRPNCKLELQGRQDRAARLQDAGNPATPPSASASRPPSPRARAWWRSTSAARR